jgi:hypothetical protein
MPDPSNPATTRRNEDPSRKWRKRRRRLRRRLRRGFDVLLVALIVVAIGLAFRHSTTTGKVHTKVAVTVTTVTTPARFDVRLTSCGYANYAATSHLTITNHLSVEQNYVVKVWFNDGKAYFSQATATVDHLAAGATAKVVASGVSTLNVPRHLSCLLFGVQRFG